MIETPPHHLLHQNIPTELAQLPQWVGWRYHSVGANKSAKVPYSLIDGGPASIRKAETWAPYSYTEGHQRIGFVFTEDDPYIGIDLDECRNPKTAELSFTARVVVRHLRSYTEVSPSGKGIKVIVRGGPLPGARRQNPKMKVEIYDSARFFALTGERLAQTPPLIQVADLEALYRWVFGEPQPPTPRTASINTGGCCCSTNVSCAYPEGYSKKRRSSRRNSNNSREPLTDEEVLGKAARAANGERFRRLFGGDISAHRSHSEADLALCALLAYWSNCDYGCIERLFARSGLNRPKWISRPDYRKRTIERAIASVGRVAL